MANLPSTFSYVTDVEVTQDADVTENLNIKLGSNDNYLKDNLDAEIATRASADSTMATQITVAQGLLNILDGVPKLQSTDVVAGAPELTTTNRSVSIWFWKDTANDKTILVVRRTNLSSDAPDYQSNFDLGVSPSLWTSANWFWFSVEDTIGWLLHSEYTF